VIKKPRERGGHSPRWAAEPEKQQQTNKQTRTTTTIKTTIFFLMPSDVLKKTAHFEGFQEPTLICDYKIAQKRLSSFRKTKHLPLLF
jgi:hypothetical protein